MKKLVYATDFSENSVAALKYAYELGKLLKTDIIVLHIFDPDDLSSARTPSEKKEIISHHKRRLQKFCSLNLQENFENLEITLAVVKGENVSSEILKFIRDIDVLMLIIGSCGSGTVKGNFPGRTAEQLISASPFPVLTVPGNFNFNGLEKMLYTTDFAEEDIKNICELLRTFKPLELKITIVHVAAGNKAEANELMEWFKELLYEKTGYKYISFRILYSTDIIESITKSLEEIEADLIVMMEHSSKLNIKSMVHRDLVKKMQSRTRIPLLSIREAR